MKRFPLYILFFLTISSGCATTSQKISKGLDPHSLQIRHDIISSLSHRNEQIQSLKGFIGIRLGSGLLTRQGELVFVVKKPYMLRFDSLTDLGVAAFQAVLSEDSLFIYWPTTETYLETAATPENLKHYFSISLEGDILNQLLRGSVPLEEEESYWLKKIGRDETSLRGKQSEITAVQEGRDYLPKRYVSFDSKGDARYVVEFQEYSKNSKLQYPKKMLVRFMKPKARIELLYREIEINPRLQKKSFQIELPNEATPLTD